MELILTSDYHIFFICALRDKVCETKLIIPRADQRKAKDKQEGDNKQVIMKTSSFALRVMRRVSGICYFH